MRVTQQLDQDAFYAYYKQLHAANELCKFLILTTGSEGQRNAGVDRQSLHHHGECVLKLQP